MADFETQKHVYNTFMSGSATKAELARQYNTSPRSIGRWIDRVKTELGGFPLEDSGVQEEEFVFNELESITDTEISALEDASGKTKSNVLFSVTLTDDAISIFEIVDGQLANHTTIDKTNEAYGECRDVIIEGGASQRSIYAAYCLSSKKITVNVLSLGKIKYDEDQDALSYDDDGVPVFFSPSLTSRLIDAVKSGTGQNLINFANKVANNQSRRCIEGLYDFLQANDIEIDEEGFVICFKKVRENYMDVHSGTFLNTVGSIVQMDRRAVNDDPNKTCSAGLHVCSEAYLGSFSGDRVMICKVDPADFVAIPYDYYSNNGNGLVKAKARVCRYEVIGEIND